MAQYTLADGDYPTASILNTYAMGEGGAWTSWTPTVTQPGAVTVTNTRSRYARYGRTIHFTGYLSVTGSGTANNAIVISLPVTAADLTGLQIGTGTLLDASTGLYHSFHVAPSSATAFVVRASSTGTSGTATPNLGVTGAPFAASLASGDVLGFGGTYEAAS